MRYAKRFRPSWKLRLVKLFLKWSWSLLENNPINFNAQIKTHENGHQEIVAYKLTVDDFEIFEFLTPESNESSTPPLSQFPKYIEDLVSEIDAEYIQSLHDNIKNKTTPDKNGTDPNQNKE